MPPVHSRYMELSNRGKRRKIEELRRAALAIAGGDVSDMSQLLADAAGSCNLTARSIGTELQAKLKVGKRDADQTRDEATKILHHVATSGSRADAAEAGCIVGKRLWRDAKNLTVRTKKKSTGRKVKVDVAYIRECWVARADHDGRIVQNIAHVSRDIAIGANCRPKQVERHKPDYIHSVKSASDLCIVCETLRSKRLLCMHKFDAPTEGARYVRSTWEKSEARATAPEEVTVLESHERTLDLLKKIYKEDEEWSQASDMNRLCVFDYAASPELSGGPRGTDYDFHSKAAVCYFGGLVMGPEGVVYHHVLDFRKPLRRTAKHALSCVKKIMASTDFRNRQYIEDLNVRLWSDTASNFRSREYIGTLLDDFGPRSMRVSFHCEGHGKTPLDGIFKQGKLAVKSVDATKVCSHDDFLKGVLEYLERSSGGPKHAVHNLTGDDVETSYLCLPKGVPVSVPYCWERRDCSPTYPEMYIDFSRKPSPFQTVDLARETAAREEDVLVTYREKMPDADKVIKRVREKNRKSTLLQNASAGL